MKKINKLLLELYEDRKQLLFLSFLVYISYLIQGSMPSDPNVNYASGWIIGGSMVVSAGIGLYSSMQASGNMDDAHELAGDNMDLQAKIAEDQLKFQKAEAAKLEKQKDIYRSMQFTNPYANVKNQYADLKNPYENLSMENVMEDLAVNTKQAEFQTQQGAQQRANIMQSMQGAAGGSGIASLAQAMASQGALQTQQISAQIGQQEAANQRLKAQGAQDVMRRQQVKMAGQGAVDMTKAQGAAAADMARRGGEASMQEMEMSRQATLLGIQMGQTSGANAALQQAYANQMSAGANQANLYGQQAAAQYGMAGDAIGSIGDMAGAYGSAQGGTNSDRKLKKNISKIGESPSGLNIYSFEYRNPIHGEGLFQGVMSDEVPQEVVGTRDGYDTVDYSMIDVEFKQI